MSLVDTTTGEVIVLMDLAEAQKVTAEIKSYSATLWLKLEEAHRGQAWRALGYQSWDAYLDAEFDISRSRGYQLVSHARAVRALADAAGVDVSTIVDTREAHTRNLDVDAATEAIASQVTEETTTEERVTVTKTVVNDLTETDEQKRARFIAACVEAIAKDPEADNATIAARVGCSVTYPRAARAEINQTAAEPPVPAPDGEPDSPEPATPAAEADDEPHAATSSEGDDRGPSSTPGVPVDPTDDLPPTPESELAAYIDAAITAEQQVRRGLLTFDPARLMSDTRRPDAWVDLAGDLIEWCNAVLEATPRHLRSLPCG